MRHNLFNRRNEVLRLPLSRAMFFEAYGNYCYCVFANKQKVLMPVGLSQVYNIIAEQQEADKSPFIRIGRRFLVNSEYIVQVNMDSLKLILSDFDHPDNFALPITKESLRKIKELYSEGKIW